MLEAALNAKVPVIIVRDHESCECPSIEDIPPTIIKAFYNKEITYVKQLSKQCRKAIICRYNALYTTQICVLMPDIVR
jgi:hypothetical protein